MKHNKAFMKKAKMRKNKKGGIEGLPLQLLIIIVVASLGLTMMVGWMNNIEEPSTISRVEIISDPAESDYDKDFDLTFIVYDNKGNPIDGANIVVTGLGATTVKPASTAGLLDDLLGLLGLEDSDDDGSSESTTAAQNNNTTYTAEVSTPIAITGSDGSANLLVYLTGLRDYGFLDIEVSKPGYGTYKTELMVAI